MLLGSDAAGWVPLDEVAFASLRSRVVMVPQDGFLFDATVADNVRYGRPGMTDAEIALAFDELGLGDWVAALADGVAHGGRPARRVAVGGGAAARRGRPGLRRRPGPAGARRGDQRGRPGHRAAADPGAGHPHQRPDHADHRAPAVHRRAGRRDPRRRRRARRAARARTPSWSTPTAPTPGCTPPGAAPRPGNPSRPTPHRDPGAASCSAGMPDRLSRLSSPLPWSAVVPWAAAAGCPAGTACPSRSPAGANDWACRPTAARPPPSSCTAPSATRRHLLDNLSAGAVAGGLLRLRPRLRQPRHRRRSSDSAAQLKDFVDRVLRRHRRREGRRWSATPRAG